jgi:HD-GYP domain-containing protein (c-di-GMP phosphodiesterase class II)
MSRSRLIVIGMLAGFAAARQRRTRQQRRLERMAAAALEVLLNAIDANDRQTGAHVRRVATYALVIARAARLSAHARRSVERVALFHDVGKIDAAMFDIVHEASELSPKERALVLVHPLRGAQVLRPLSAFYPDLAEGVLSHHERWDGTGYPRRLRGEEIPLAARIVAIADTFDVVTHGRRYRRAGRGSLADGRSALRAGRGTQFDPALVDLVLEPSVFGALRGAVRALHAPRVWRREGGRSRTVSGVPDITFRWRSESLEPLPRDPGR